MVAALARQLGAEVTLIDLSPGFMTSLVSTAHEATSELEAASGLSASAG